MDCENCGRREREKPSIFRGERWCSDLCRKALAETLELQIKAFGPCYICGDVRDHEGTPHGIATGDGKTRADADNEKPVLTPRVLKDSPQA